ncbi:MAG: hypothetical protein PHV82_09615 [Victivallaceae bacterium]|nr:hypothetical protein [Victivallaceae bacterium]
MKDIQPNYRRFLYSIIRLVFCAGLCLLSSCCRPYASVGNPKVYGDSQTRMLLDRLHKDVRSYLPSITDATPQSASRIQQEYGKLFTFKVEPAGSATSTSKPESLLQLTPIQMPAEDETTALGFTQTLRERIRRQQDVSRHEMLYIGDQNFLEEGKSLYLIRLDMTLLLSWALSCQEYIIVNFTLRPFYDNKADIAGTYRKFTENIKIYALAPEYASALSKDSLLSRSMKELNGALSGSVKGLNLSAEANLEKQLEQYFTSTNEMPLQFAIPRSRDTDTKQLPKVIKEKDAQKLPHPEYAFAFGPQRHIVKRSWINPCRWFGDTYVINYEHVPTTVDCYALIIVDDSFFGNTDSARLKLQVNVFERLDSFNCGVNWDWRKKNIGDFTIELCKGIASDPAQRLRELCDDARVVFSSINTALDSTFSACNKAKIAKKEAADAAKGIEGIDSIDTCIKSLTKKYNKARKKYNKSSAKEAEECRSIMIAAEEKLDKAVKVKTTRQNYDNVLTKAAETVKNCTKKLQTFRDKRDREIGQLASGPLKEIDEKYKACAAAAAAAIKQVKDSLGSQKISTPGECENSNMALNAFKYTYFSMTGASAAPDSINPVVDSTIIVHTSKLPVTPATFLTVDGIAVSSSNTTVLGKHMLMAKIPILKPFQKLAADTEVDCIVATPGIQGEERFKLRIRKNVTGSEPEKPILTLAPEKGRIGETVTITSNNSAGYPLSSVTSVIFGTKVIAQSSFLFQNSSKIIFNVPEPDKDITASVGVAVLPQFDKFTELKFTYAVPLAASQADKE